MSAPVLEVSDLAVYFPVAREGLFGGKRTLRAVDGVSFSVGPGETLGLVGESGCGKTTVGRAILRLTEPTRGDVRFQGESILALRGARLREARRHLQVVFQDPFGSLNPRMSVSAIVEEGLTIHGLGTKAERRRKVGDLLERVGLTAEAGRRFPHEFSGGQRQRIGIARALATEPSFIVCDEAVSALDVSVQAQILNLLKDLQQERGLSYLFISHDLAVVEHLAHRVCVMYLGRVVEEGPAEALYREPRHPYTRALLEAIPREHPGRERPAARWRAEGDPPSPIDPPSGCRFRTRCPIAIDRCSEPPIESVEVGPGHHAACLRTEETVEKADGLV
ncbi:MAG: ABC transporter ATP-binding protein [Planctomycetota bacterium]|jgi:oligopeptide/dipeptide ABC transporter ATP-binding protein